MNFYFTQIVKNLGDPANNRLAPPPMPDEKAGKSNYSYNSHSSRGNNMQNQSENSEDASESCESEIDWNSAENDAQYEYYKMDFEEIEQNCNRIHGLTFEQKKMMFNYIKCGKWLLESYKQVEEKLEMENLMNNVEDKTFKKMLRLKQMRKEYITNVILIFNSFFEYGFTNNMTQKQMKQQIQAKKNTFSFGFGYNDDLDQAIQIEKSKTNNAMMTGEDAETNPYYSKFHHYWEFISTNCSHLDSVKFMNFHQNNEGKTINELGIRWVILAIYKRDDLMKAFCEIVGDQNFLMLYSMDDSYAWQCKRDIFEIFELLNGNDMYNQCPILDEFIRYIQERQGKGVLDGFLNDVPRLTLQQPISPREVKVSTNRGSMKRRMSGEDSQKGSVLDQGLGSIRTVRSQERKSENNLNQDIGPQIMSRDSAVELINVKDSEKSSFISNNEAENPFINRIGLLGDNSVLLDKQSSQNKKFLSNQDSFRRMPGDENDDSIDYISPEKELMFWNPSSYGGGSRKNYVMNNLDASASHFKSKSGIDEQIQFKSFHLSHQQDLKSPNYDETIIEPQSEPKQQFERNDIEIFSSHSASYHSSQRSKKPKVQKFSLKNFGLCYSPTKTDLSRTVFLDGEGNQIKFQGNQQVKLGWSFIDPRNRKNYRLMVKCNPLVIAKQSLLERKCEIQEQFHHYCLINEIDFFADSSQEMMKSLQEKIQPEPEVKQEISLMPLTNSDMVFNNEFLRKNKDQIYSPQLREEWKNNIKNLWFHQCKILNVPYKPLNLQEQCSLCFTSFYEKSWMLKYGLTQWIHGMLNDKNKFFCHFCMEYHCRDCMVQNLGDLKVIEQKPADFDHDLKKANSLPLRNSSDHDSCCLEFEEKEIPTEQQIPFSNSQIFLPALMQFQLKQLSMEDLEDNEFHLVCKESVQFMSKFKYVFIHNKNPLAHNKKLRKILKLRRSVHKLFDQIKCSEWDKIFVKSSSSESTSARRSKTVVYKSKKVYPVDEPTKDDTDSVYFGQNVKKIRDLKKYKNMVLRDCYLTFEQLNDLEMLEKKLIQIKYLLQNHLENECTRCDYVGDKCQFCIYSDRKKKRVLIYDIESAATCPKCLKVGHRECILEHQCFK